MPTHPQNLARSFLSYFVLPMALLGAACEEQAGDEPILDDASATLQPDGGVTATTTPDLGGENSLTLPADAQCLDDTITVDEAQGLCQWGTGVLGPEGTAFQAGCMDIVYDAGATAGPTRAMVDMIVLSQANCLAKIRTSYAGCPYTVGQFKSSVEGFHAGDCSGASLNILVGYKDKSLW
jgi:hypothetical protein